VKIWFINFHIFTFVLYLHQYLSSMNYQSFEPPDILKPYVRYFWSLETDADNPSEKSFRTIVDGCPGLIFQQNNKGTFYKDDQRLPETFLFGQSTKHAELNLSGNLNVTGIYFYPNALKSVFGLNAEELTNSCMDANLLVHDFYLSEQLANASSLEEQVEILSSYLVFQIEKNVKQDDKIMQFALTQIIQSKGTIPLQKLQKQLQLSERMLERRFKQYVGLSPKLFLRICRFQSSLKQLRNNDYSKLSDIAFENDYADQSHFIRSFKEFAGFSPYQYQKKSTEVVENFAELIK
jgi:AraC-like DNA-binding protein